MSLDIGRLIAGGNATVRVSDLDRAIRFYTQVLDLTLVRRAGSGWALLDAGRGLLIGLQAGGLAATPADRERSSAVGLDVGQPLEEVIATLHRRGVHFHGDIVDAPGAARLAHFADPDGNELYLCERR
ncbi:MAG: VOC family protein [Myxococcota bacterium]